MGIACWSIRDVVWRICTKCTGHRVCNAFVAVWYTHSWLKKYYKVWCGSTPNWIPDGFKFQASTISLWWTMGEGSACTIELACGVGTLVLSAHKLLLANDRPRLNIFTLITLSITVFTCNYYLLIKVLVHGKSKWCSNLLLHFLPCFAIGFTCFTYLANHCQYSANGF